MDSYLTLLTTKGVLIVKDRKQTSKLDNYLYKYILRQSLKVDITRLQQGKQELP